MQVYEGVLNAQGLRFGVIVSRFNHAVTDLLVEGALDCLLRHGANEDEIEVLKVPGAFEIPLVAKKMALSERFDAIICLGAVIRGATAHFDLVASQVASGVMQTSLNTEIPILFGVLTVDSIEQALERAGTKMGNLGFNYAMSAIELAQVLKAFDNRLL